MKIATLTLLSVLNLLAIDGAANLPVSLTEQFVFEPGGVVEVRGNFTDLVVEGWDEPDVEVTMTWRDPGLCCTGSLDDSVGYDARKQEKDHFVISAEEPLPGPSRFRIRVPKRSSLVIHEPHKRLSISGVRGEVQVSSAQKLDRTTNTGQAAIKNSKVAAGAKRANLRTISHRRGCPVAVEDPGAERTGRYAEI